MLTILKRISLGLIAAGLFVGPAVAGIHYEAVTETRPERGDVMRMKVSAWIEGDSAKILFEESDNPMATAGKYLVTTDAGRTLYLVDPQERTYAEWNLDEMMATLGSVMEDMGPMFDMEFADPETKKLIEEDGGEILGRAVTHYRYSSSYTMKMKVLGMKRSDAVERVQDIWSTTELGDAALGVWLRNAPQASGNEQIDRLIADEMAKIQGFPLKVEEVQTVRDKKGRESVTRTRQEVTKLEESSIDASTFEIPAGFQRIEMMPAVSADQEAEGNPLKSLFGRKKKDG